MSLLSIPKDIKHAMLVDPLNKLCKSKNACLTVNQLRITDNLVESLNSNNSSFKKLRGKHLFNYFEL